MTINQHTSFCKFSNRELAVPEFSDRRLRSFLKICSLVDVNGNAGVLNPRNDFHSILNQKNLIHRLFLMGFQQSTQHHTSAGGVNAGDGVSHHQRVHSPSYNGSMTRRGHSFKRNGVNGGEIDPQTSSPHSSSDSAGGSPRHDAAEPSSPIAVSPGAERRQHGHSIRSRFGMQILGKDVFKKPASGVPFRNRRRLGNLLFLMFCSVVLFFGLMKIFGGSWRGSLVFETAELHQELLTEMTGEKAGLSSSNGSKHSEIWAKPNSENFKKCIEPAYYKRLDAMTNGYILINANGGLNQMRFGV